MSETNNNPFAVAEREAKVMEYVPFGGQDKIKLTIQIVQNLIAVPTRSGKTCSDRDAVKFMAMCQAKRLNPFEGDAFLIGYDESGGGATFSLITAHQAFLKRAEIHPEFDGMKSGIIVQEDGKLLDIEGDFHLEDQMVVGGWATVYFKSRKYPTTRRIRLGRFNKGFAQWKVDPAGMICKCAEADSLRSSFPTMLGGLYMREEVEVFTGPSTTPLLAISKPVFDVSAEPAAAEGQEEAAAGSAPATPETGKTARSKSRTKEDSVPVPVDRQPEQPQPGPQPIDPEDTSKPHVVLAQLLDGVSKAELTQDEVMEYCKRHDMATAVQTSLSQLATRKLVGLCERWPEIVQEIRAATSV